MISNRIKRYCKDYKKIEGYEQAINDESQIWECHHRFETAVGLTKQQLIDCDLYYDRPSCELIFLTKNEHTKIHHKGKHIPEEIRQNMSKPRSEEHRKHIGEARKGKYHSDESKQKMSETLKGKNKGKHRVYHSDGTYHMEKNI